MIGFDGRESDYPYGLWGALAGQLGQKDVFASLYSPLQAPGVTSWIHLRKGEPTLILLDELPPYFNAAKSISVGASDLAEVTTTALANLLVAVNKTELENVVVVISDLSGMSYAQGGANINTALDDLERETKRGAVRLEPVATTGDKVYHILQTRLFESLPDAAVKDKVAAAYAESVRQAKQMDLTAESPESFASQLRESYPFHFSLRDLYGRFKANPGLQQTRGLLRLMRAIVANLCESGQADGLALIHPYDIDLNDQDIFSEFSSINPSLGEAVRMDIANSGASHAEELDRKLGGTAGGSASTAATMAQAAAKLIYVSSLASVQGAVIGLRDSETIAWLCAPGRGIARIRTDVLEQLPNAAWYLHLSNDGRLFFKNVQNLAAKLHSMVNSFNRENKMKELSGYLQTIFKPNLSDVYQECRVLPSWEDVQPQVERTVLVLTEPHAGARPDAPLHQDWIRFYDNLEYKNRNLFLTGDRGTLEEVLKNAAYLKAVKTVLAEQETDGLSERDPQRQEAKTSETKALLALRSAVQQTFRQVVYPSGGKLRTESFKLTFQDNNFDAEGQIRDTLFEVRKFSKDQNLEQWADKIKARLFDGQNPVPWNEVKVRAAVKPSWQLHPPRLFEDVKAHAVRIGIWREEGGSVRTGPFPAEPKVWRNRIFLRSRQFQQGQDQYIELIPAPSADVFYTTDGSDPRTRGAAYAGPFPIPKGVRLVQDVARSAGVESEVLRCDVSTGGPRPVLDSTRSGPGTTSSSTCRPRHHQPRWSRLPSASSGPASCRATRTWFRSTAT